MLEVRPKTAINSFDYDGTLTQGIFDLRPNVDIVLTGRTFNEASIVYSGLQALGIKDVAVFFNPLALSIRGDHSEDARRKSALHKVSVLTQLAANHEVTHWEDDPIQIELIRGMLPYITVIDVGNPEQNYYGENN